MKWFYTTAPAQILSLLPPLHGKSVLELGAGIGRFTGELAKDAGQVIAVDFIDSVIKKVCMRFSFVCGRTLDIIFIKEKKGEKNFRHIW